MLSFRAVSKYFFILFIMVALAACQTAPKEIPLTVTEDPAQGVIKAKEIRENTAVQLADGLVLSLWASDSLAPDPVAMSIDDDGRVYLTRTNRQKNSEFDIRGHRGWMTPSIGLQSVEDRRAFLHTTFAPEKSKENEWLEDLNKDSIHDWHDLAVEKEEVWRLEDTSGDGIADKSTRILNDFHDEVTDVAGGILVRKEDVFLAVGPDMWRLKDTNNDDVLDQKESIAHGYAVHVGFSGHGMSGVTEGPDGKIYWNIGDIGSNVTTKDGKTFKYPNQGTISRCNPDGSNFEVFAAGLRNTHEFAFDDYGNLISSDNDGDHPGESERLVYIVDGSDAGWRSNWQYGKYTDPKNNLYKVWMDEGFDKPRWEGQAAHIIPPIINFHNGPTGFVYNPGTALGNAWKNKFFVVEFVGNPSRSNIWAFNLKPKGASFELGEEQNVVNGILPTGIHFGPDGALYVADWINGWGTKNYGRVWKLDVSADKNDLAAQRTETKRLMQLNYSKQSIEELAKLLSYQDMRIRKKAQFELVKRGGNGFDVFKETITNQKNQLARIHSILGIGQLSETNKTQAASLVELLKDNDPEIAAQAAKVIGDVNYVEAGSDLLPLLNHQYPRAKFFAAQALGRIKYKQAVDPLIKMLEENNDEDVYIRHAAVLALSRIGAVEPMVALSTNSSRALRIAAVLVLRRLQSEKVALFLQDKDEYIVTEAARAINDDTSIAGALPALAAVLKNAAFTSEPLLRRGINACLRVGGETELDILIAFAKRAKVSTPLKAEALATLGSWASPSLTDRVDGYYRGKIERNPELVKTKVKLNAEFFLQSKEPQVLVSTSQMLSELNINDYNDRLAIIMQQNTAPEVRSAIITALHKLKYKNMESVIKKGMNDKDEMVRATSLDLLTELNITKEALPGIVDPIFKKGTVKEQQHVLGVLGRMPVEKSEPILLNLINQLKNQKLSPSLTLDLLEAVDSTKSEKLIAVTGSLRSKGSASSIDAFQETLFGGDWRQGANYFFREAAGQCVRCHSIGGNGGNVGPSLSKIGDVLTRDQLLQALIEPSARLSPGFGSVTLTLKDGQVVSGILMEEKATELVIKTSEAEPMKVPVARITKRVNALSGMPPMGTLMSKKEIRDIIEFLAGLKER